MARMGSSATHLPVQFLQHCILRHGNAMPCSFWSSIYVSSVELSGEMGLMAIGHRCLFWHTVRCPRQLHCNKLHVTVLNKTVWWACWWWHTVQWTRMSIMDSTGPFGTLHTLVVCRYTMYKEDARWALWTLRLALAHLLEMSTGRGWSQCQFDQYNILLYTTSYRIIHYKSPIFNTVKYSTVMFEAL